MMGHRPVSTGYVVNYDNNGRPDPEDNEAHLWCNIDDFMAMMRQQYPDWNEFEEWMSHRLAAGGTERWQEIDGNI